MRRRTVQSKIRSFVSVLRSPVTPFGRLKTNSANREVLQSEIRMQIFVKLGLRTHESTDGQANRRVVLQSENWSFCSIGLLVMVLAAGGVWSFDRSVWQPSLVVCTVWDQLFRVVSCSVVVEDFRTSLFSDCSLMKTVTSKKKSWCAALPTRKRKIKSIASSVELNRFPSTAAPGSKSHPACHSPKSKRRSTEHHRSPNLDVKKCWQIQLNGKNKPNHWIHLTKVRSRNEKFVRKEGRPHELSCGYSRTCAIFFAPRPRALQFLFCKTSQILRRMGPVSKSATFLATESVNSAPQVWGRN